jgi:hypothetical protein
MAAGGRTARTLGLTLSGLVGGLLTFSYLLPRRLPSNLVMGLSPSAFGLALAGYFWLVNRDRSILKGASLTAISWATFWFAFIIAAGESQQLGYLSEPHAGSNPTPALFIVWQTGMGFLIGCFWPTIEAREPRRLSIVERGRSRRIPIPFRRRSDGAHASLHALLRSCRGADAGCGPERPHRRAEVCIGAVQSP